MTIDSCYGRIYGHGRDVAISRESQTTQLRHLAKWHMNRIRYHRHGTKLQHHFIFTFRTESKDKVLDLPVISIIFVLAGQYRE